MGIDRSCTPWIGVDLDGTLSQHGHEFGDAPPWKIGQPVPLMVKRVKALLAIGLTVKIFTARVANLTGDDLANEVRNIQAWCLDHVGVVLEVTATKDFGLRFFYDDRAMEVIQNTGVLVGHEDRN